MAHDPLCDSDDDPYNCHCGLIAKVRVDERNRCIAEVEKSWTLSHRITTGPIRRITP